MFENRLTKLLGTKYPIIQGGMAWVSEGNLAAAVSEAGGVGIIAGANAPIQVIREEIKKAKLLTNKPFGVNILLISPFADELSDLIIEEGVKIVTTGAGSPGKYIEKWKAADIVVIPVVASVALAKRMERLGANAVIAEGCESGGHIGELTTMALVPQVVDAVDIPVIAAGGIADGRGITAALALGAEGVQCGTCFIVAKECIAHPNFKRIILEAGDTDTVVTGRSTGHPVRAIKNKLTRKFLEMEKNDATLEELELIGVGAVKRAALEGNKDEGTFCAGQIAGLVKEERTAKEIIERLFDDAREEIIGLSDYLR